jgi:hypothetical protein
LKDDGNYMVPAVSDKETGDSSGNALFDFGRGAGTPLSKTAGKEFHIRTHTADTVQCAQYMLPSFLSSTLHVISCAPLICCAPGEPIPGLLPKQYWRKTGTSEPHFPNSIRQFDINGIRE